MSTSLVSKVKTLLEDNNYNVFDYGEETPALPAVTVRCLNVPFEDATGGVFPQVPIVEVMLVSEVSYDQELDMLGIAQVLWNYDEVVDYDSDDVILTIEFPGLVGTPINVWSITMKGLR